MRRLCNEKGNVSIAFFVYMFLFLFAMILILNLSKVWYAHSQSQTSADAAALAATRKVNEMIMKDGDVITAVNAKLMERISKILNENPGMSETDARRKAADEMVSNEEQRDALYFADYELIPLANLLQLAYDNNSDWIGERVNNILSSHQQELADYVKEYLEKNGSISGTDKQAHGRIEIPYNTTGRIRVIARTDLKPVGMSGLKLPEFPQVEGDGVGPSVAYLKKMPSLTIEF